MFALNGIELHADHGEDAAGCLLFSLFGCTSMAPQRTDAVAVDVPTAWSGAIASTGLDASWELDIFGANRSAVAASEATARVSAARLGGPTRDSASYTAFPYSFDTATQITFHPSTLCLPAR